VENNIENNIENNMDDKNNNDTIILLALVSDRLKRLQKDMDTVKAKVTNGHFKKTQECFNDKRIVYKNIDEIKNDIKGNGKDIRNLMIKISAISLGSGAGISGIVLLAKNLF